MTDRPSKAVDLGGPGIDPALTLEGPGISDLLARQAADSPDQTFVWTPEEDLTYADAQDKIERLASGLQRRGVGVGDRVALFMSNGATQVLLWMALDRIGAVNVALNTGLTERLLARALSTTAPSLIVVDHDLLTIVIDSLRTRGASGSEGLPTVLVHGLDRGEGWSIGGGPIVPLVELPHEGPVDRVAVGRLCPSIMLFTICSTGVPKAFVLSRQKVVRAGRDHVNHSRVTADDVLFTPFALCHIDAATLTVATAVVAGATAALAERFSATRFWDQVRLSQATIVNLMGATADTLWKRPANALDRRHRVRLAWGVLMPACEPAWAERFGFPLVEVCGLTDAGVPAYQLLEEPGINASCGRLIPEHDVIADQDGTLVPPALLARSSSAAASQEC